MKMVMFTPIINVVLGYRVNRLKKASDREVFEDLTTRGIKSVLTSLHEQTGNFIVCDTISSGVFTIDIVYSKIGKYVAFKDGKYRARLASKTTDKFNKEAFRGEIVA